jgi:hypothetical protein
MGCDIYGLYQMKANTKGLTANRGARNGAARQPAAGEHGHEHERWDGEVGRPAEAVSGESGKDNTPHNVRGVVFDLYSLLAAVGYWSVMVNAAELVMARSTLSLP